MSKTFDEKTPQESREDINVMIGNLPECGENLKVEIA